MRTAAIGVALWMLALPGLAAGQEPATQPAEQADLDGYLWQVRADVPVTGELAKGVQADLAAEVGRMVKAGHLAPFRISTGESGGEFWFASPGTLCYSLAITLPFLPPEQRPGVLAYLKGEVTKYPPGGGLLPVREGARRERYAAAPEFFAGEKRVEGYSRLSGLYGLWAYGHYTGDWAAVEAQWEQALGVFSEGGKVSTLQDVQGLIGFARIARKLGKPQAAAALAAREALGRARNVEAMAINAAAAYNPAGIPRQGYPQTLYKGFWDLTPEVGRFLADHAREPAERIRADMEWRMPLWYASQSPVPNEWWPNIPAAGEDTFNPPRIAGPLFLARAYVAGDGAATLERFLDIPYCLGDLDYLQQCVALLRVYGQACWMPLKE